MHSDSCSYKTTLFAKRRKDRVAAGLKQRELLMDLPLLTCKTPGGIRLWVPRAGMVLVHNRIAQGWSKVNYAPQWPVSHISGAGTQ